MTFATGWNSTLAAAPTADLLPCRPRFHTVSAQRQYWMDASRTDRNNPRHAERISYRKTER
jgi:hypothetical protein